MQIREQILWGLFGFTILTSLVNIAGGFMGGDFFRGNIIGSLNFLPVLLVLLHAGWTKSYARGIAFFVLAGLTGFISEYIALKYGVFFGGEYIYNMDGSRLASVPVNVIIFWSFFIYTGYCITNSFLYWLGHKMSGRLLPLAVLMDGLIVVIIDLFIDPLQVLEGAWSWTGGSSYFNIPVGNFIGWFFVAIISTTIFRTYEYLRPRKDSLQIPAVHLIPVLGYGLLYLIMLAASLRYGMFGLSLIGSALMLPVIISNVVLFTKSPLHTLKV